jgi:glycosyltransferase involved in cell wall biosynthesis
MKVLHVVQGYFPAIGGTERLIQMVSEKLVANHGDEVTVFTTPAYNCELFWRTDQPSLPVGEETIRGVRVRRYPVCNRLNRLRRKLSDFTTRYKLPRSDYFRTLFGGPIIPGLTQEIARFKADMVAASSFPLMHMYYAVEGSRLGRKPVVLHGGIHISDAWGFERPMIYRAIRRADAYIANTTFERDFLISRNIEPSRITPIGVGVDPEPLERGDRSILRRRFRLGDDPVVAFVGQQVPHKGIDIVIDAMTYVWKEIPKARLLIAGSRTTFSDSLGVRISRLPTDQKLNVVVYDNFEESEKPAIYAASNLLAFPSVYESFGIVFVEAWAAGLPVIGCRIDAISSVVDDGIDGLLFTPHDRHDLGRAILRLLKNEEERKRMGEAGRRKVKERYTWDIVAARFREVYLEAIEARGGKVPRPARPEPVSA